MKLFNIRRATALSTVVLALNAYAGDDGKKEIVPVEPPPAVSRWSLSMGATVSSIKSTFNVDPGVVNGLNAGGGSTGIYNGGPEQFYQNGGTVGAGGPAADPLNAGSTTFANPSSQVVPTGRPPGPGTLGSATFNGTGFSPLGGSSDTELSVGPYIKLAFDAFDFDSNTLHLGPFFQYTFTTAFDSGPSGIGATNVATTYATYLNPAIPPSVVGVAFNPGRPASGPFAIYNATANGVGTNPTQTATGQFALVASSVNIDMHTFTLGMDFTKDLCDRVHLVLSTGPTLNLFETSLTSTPVGLPLAPVNSSQSTVRFGWIGQLGVTVDLDSRKRWFVEGSGNYHYVDPFTVSTGLTSARIEASSWGAELGVGLRF